MADAPRVTTAVRVRDAKEPWSEYTLADGSVVRCRLLLHSIRRVENQFAPNGDPLYDWAAMPMFEVVAPEGLRVQVDVPGRKMDS